MMLYIEKGWFKYYSSRNYKKYFGKIFGLNETGSYFISFCNFRNIGPNGTVIFQNPGENLLFLHEFCSYTNCSKDNKYGGAFFVSKGYECIQEGIIASKCYSEMAGQFCYVELIYSNLEKNRNFLFTSSIELNSYDKDIPGYEAIVQSVGLAKTDSVNISFCKSLYIIANNVFTFYKGSYLKYSNFYNNSKTLNNMHPVTNINERPVSFLISNCAYHKNSDFGTGGSIIGVASINISNCCISENNFESSFNIKDSYTVFVTNSYIDIPHKNPNSSGKLEINSIVEIIESCYYHWSSKEYECLQTPFSNYRCYEHMNLLVFVFIFIEI